MDPIGKIAYDAYCESSDGKSLISGEALPNWFALPEEIKNAWTAASAAVVNHTRFANETRII